ncbi:hypothetical protein DMN91_011382 [Ooceraea biroi]|uniref:Reverse transcriptase domain-containing protein n=1 Tax=Ooceraea biroi TaxID=2015173 RepID=A0A3L8D5X0_OOCBI|nr:hypothetical protein DMN91_011382 [Ooceraea biroi]
MQDLRTALKLVLQDYFMASLDLQDALCTSPYVFTKIMRPVMASLREQGFISVDYLDDILLIGKNHDECYKNVQEKKLNILNMLRKTVNKSKVTIRDFAQLIGTLVAACPGVQYGWAHIKTLEREKELALILNGRNYEDKISLSVGTRSQFDWWERNLPNAFSNFRKDAADTVVFTDASTSGWGAVLENKKIHGFWSGKEKQEHINLLELKAVWLALLSFEAELRNCHVLLRVDNTTAISYINRMRGIKYQKFNLIATRIWRWAEKNNVWLHAEHISSNQNSIADRLSRLKNLGTEWELADYAFNEIINTFGFPEIDLFATGFNTISKIALITLQVDDTSNGAAPYTTIRHCLREAYLRRNLSTDCIEILIASLSDNTLKQYNSALRRWWNFCMEKTQDPFVITTSDLLEFLTDLFRQGTSYGSLTHTGVQFRYCHLTRLERIPLLVVS